VWTLLGIRQCFAGSLGVGVSLRLVEVNESLLKVYSMLFDKVWVFGMSVSRADFSKFLYLVGRGLGLWECRPRTDISRVLYFVGTTLPTGNVMLDLVMLDL
jgi:hypothetical protein